MTERDNSRPRHQGGTDNEHEGGGNQEEEGDEHRHQRGHTVSTGCDRPPPTATAPATRPPPAVVGDVVVVTVVAAVARGLGRPIVTIRGETSSGECGGHNNMHIVA